MAEKSYPLNMTEYDATDAQLWHATRTSGVYAMNHLAVKPGGGMLVALSTGVAWLAHSMFGGVVYANTLDLSLTLPYADATLDRYDRIMIRYDVVANTVSAVVRQGVAASSPQKPAPQRDGFAYEICVASILRPKGATEIGAQHIVDERMNAEVCGLMSDGVTRLDTQAFYQQITSDLAYFRGTQQAAFLAWFADMRDTLSGDVAGNLLDKMQEIKTDGALNVYTHTKTGKVHNFSGSGVNGRAKITAAFAAGDTFAVNGAACPAYAGAGAVAKLPAGHWATFVYDGTMLDFGGDADIDAASQRSAMGLGNTTGPLPIANGGTGASEGMGARANLGLKNGAETEIQRGSLYVTVPSSSTPGLAYTYFYWQFSGTPCVTATVRTSVPNKRFVSLNGVDPAGVSFYVYADTSGPVYLEYIAVKN